MIDFNLNSLILVTGAARSGKSEWAENLAYKTNLPVIYIATAQIYPDDHKWQERIEKHRQRRPKNWQTLEIPYKLGGSILEVEKNHCILIDSLGTWVANYLEENDIIWQETQENLLNSLKKSSNHIILVAEETGWGVIPSFASGRLFRDRLGYLIRSIGAIANIMYLVIGGYAIDIKDIGISVNNDQ